MARVLRCCDKRGPPRPPGSFLHGCSLCVITCRLFFSSFCLGGSEQGGLGTSTRLRTPYCFLFCESVTPLFTTVLEFDRRYTLAGIGRKKDHRVSESTLPDA